MERGLLLLLPLLPLLPLLVLLLLLLLLLLLELLLVLVPLTRAVLLAVEVLTLLVQLLVRAVLVLAVERGAGTTCGDVKTNGSTVANWSPMCAISPAVKDDIEWHLKVGTCVRHRHVNLYDQPQ